MDETALGYRCSEGRGGREGLPRKPSALLHPSQIQLSGRPETSFFQAIDLSLGPSRSRSRGRLRVCGDNPSRPTISAFTISLVTVPYLVVITTINRPFPLTKRQKEVPVHSRRLVVYGEVPKVVPVHSRGLVVYGEVQKEVPVHRREQVVYGGVSLDSQCLPLRQIYSVFFEGGDKFV